jgi:hypothetical protein
VNGGTTISSPNTPTGIADGDALFAFVHTTTNTTITAPAGWTEVIVAGATAGSGYSKLYAFRKDTVTSGNANTSYTWTAGATVQLSLAYACVRATAGNVQVIAAVKHEASNQSESSVIIPYPGTTAAFNGSMFLCVDGTYWTENSSISPTIYNATGHTQWTGSQFLNLMSGIRWPRNQGQTVGTAESTRFSGPVTNNGEVAITLNLAATAVEDTLVDSISFEEYVGQYRGILGATTDSFSLTPIPTPAAVAAAADGMFWAATVEALRSVAALATDTTNMTPAASVFPRWGAANVDTVSVGDSHVAASRFARTILETAAMAPAALIARGVVASDTVISGHNALVVAQGVALLEALLLPDTVAPRTQFNVAATVTVALSDALRRFIGGAALDSAVFTEALLGDRVTPAVASDIAQITDALAGKLLLRVTAAETVTLDDVEVLKALYRGDIAEGVEIVAGYVSPGDGFTTWAVNTRTGAATEYTAFEFNSFTRMGQRYLAANSTGLYVLDGDTDAGASIVADIKTGIAQFAGSRFTTVQAVYLGMRGEGDFVLRIVEGDGTIRNYAVKAQNMRTVKVQTGKGIRARYLSFELISTGQDFDLDSIEMVPIGAQRRV